MRRQLLVIFIAVTTMIAIAFVVPLALLVRDVAREGALEDASSEAASLAPTLAVTEDPESVELAISRTVAGREGRLSVYLADGTRIGATLERSDRVIEGLTEGRASTGDTPFGAEVVVPLARSDGATAVVHVVVPAESLRRGVATAWLALGVVGLAAVVGSVLLADRFARSVTRPVTALAEASHRLGTGDLDARVTPAGPPEVMEVGESFNLLAGRVDDLLHAQREDVADLAHRLRTPLAALRLQLDQVADPDVRAQLSASTDALARSLDLVIAEARRTAPVGAPPILDLGAMVRERSEFWGALADDQGREVELDLADGSVLVRAAEDDLRALLDVLFENVFAHTDDGTSYRVSLRGVDDHVEVRLDDAGNGFADEESIERGVSDSSTGLGLDIARRTAESMDGSLEIGTSDLGGASVSVRLPAVMG